MSMSQDEKNAIIDRLAAKQKRSAARTKTTASRKAPEKAFQNALLKHMRSLGFDVTYMDSSTFGVAVNISKTGEYGISDLVGNIGSLSVWVEVKAPGRLKSLKVHQYMFLRRKLEAGCFACCVDSIERFDELWKLFQSADFPGELIEELPTNPQIKDALAPLSFD